MENTATLESAPTTSAHPATSCPREPFGKPFGKASAALIVLAFLLAGHIWSLNTGLFLDDHAHFANLRSADWSLRAAVESSRLGIVGDVLDVWGREDTGLRFFRPVAFWIMKAEYTLVGWQPAGMHIFSLGWHYLCALLVGALALRCFGSRPWATVAACLMAIHPAHTATVYWIACQTELITTAFLLIGILAYARAAGWGQNGREPWFTSISQRTPPANPDSPADATDPLTSHFSPLTSPADQRGTLIRIFPGAIAVLCYALALGCRENAVLFPAVCWAGDRLCGSARRRWLRWEHLAMLAVLGGYFWLRTRMLGGFEMPVRPYIVPVSDPGFVEFILSKIVYYVLGLFAYIPVVPMSGQAYFASRPVTFYGGFAVIAGVLILVWAAYRFRPALVWPVVWIALLIAPVLPVFASSHHLYLPGAGAVLLLTAGLAALGGINRPDPPSRPRKALIAVVVGLLAAGLPLVTWASGFAYQAGTRSEDAFVREIIERGGPIRDGDHLFFINMPLLAYYAVPAIEAETGRKDLVGHVLTFSPDLLKMETPGRIEIIGDRQIRVRAPAGRAYFEGVTGQALLDVLGRPQSVTGDVRERLTEGQPIPAGVFTVTPTRISNNGVEELVFTFERPIDSPEYHFFFGSPQFLAYPLDVLRPDSAGSNDVTKTMSQPAS